jgi:NAD(P)-dependent dehydrogenase (short-subunit alcohol dehydrogenase family)
LGTAKRLPEFNLAGKVVLVSGAGRGLGLVQAEALLEAGATGLCTRDQFALYYYY